MMIRAFIIRAFNNNNNMIIRAFIIRAFIYEKRFNLNLFKLKMSPE